MATAHEYRGEETYRPVYSRIGWGAIVAGAAVALAIYVLLGLLGSAVGLSVQAAADDPDRAAIAAGAGVWAIISMVIALFIGGWVASQCAIGENRMEAALHGVVLWAVLFAVLVWFASVGIGLGLDAMLGQAGLALTAQMADADVQMQAAWWAFAGTLLSILAAVGGAMFGASQPYVLHERGYRGEHRPAAGGGPGAQKPTV